jgi:hypothetical protein
MILRLLKPGEQCMISLLLFLVVVDVNAVNSCRVVAESGVRAGEEELKRTALALRALEGGSTSLHLTFTLHLLQVLNRRQAPGAVRHLRT